MNANVNITIDFAPGAISAINQLVGIVSGLLGGVALTAGRMATQEVESEPPTQKPAVTVDKPVASQSELTTATAAELATATAAEPAAKPTAKPAVEPTEKAVPTKPTPAITLVDMRAVAATKAREVVKALLDKYECSSLSGVPEVERATFLAELKAS